MDYTKKVLEHKIVIVDKCIKRRHLKILQDSDAMRKPR
jgi:hypothetical protein